MTYKIEEIRQLDIQKLGGIYHKYPVSKVVADMISNLGNIVVDTTYGKGRFYAVYRPQLLIGIDVKKWNWIVKPDRFFNCTTWQFYNMLRRKSIFIEHADIVVADSPKWHNNKYKRSEYNYIIGTPKLIIYYAYNVAKLLNARYLLLHYYKIVGDIIDKDKIARVIRYYFISRYTHVGPKTFSYFILYDLQKK
jgi:hypothetical protein